MSRRVAIVAVLAASFAGCWRGQPAPPADLSAHADDVPSYAISERAAGPWDATVTATRAALQARAPGLRVALEDLGADAGIVLNVYDGKERLFYVVPDDAPGWTDEEGTHRYAHTIFAVFAVSPRVTVAHRSWRVGQPFEDAAGIDRCECWGDDTVTACFHKGSHVRLVFEVPCHPAAEQGASTMVGTPIGRIMWKRELEPPAMLED